MIIQICNKLVTDRIVNWHEFEVPSKDLSMFQPFERGKFLRMHVDIEMSSLDRQIITELSNPQLFVTLPSKMNTMHFEEIENDTKDGDSLQISL